MMELRFCPLILAVVLVVNCVGADTTSKVATGAAAVASHQAGIAAQGGYQDQQVAGQGYKASVYLGNPDNNVAKQVPIQPSGGYGGAVQGSAGANYAYDYNVNANLNQGNLNQGKDLQYSGSFGPSSYSQVGGAVSGGYGPAPTVESSYGPPPTHGGNPAPYDGQSYTYHYTHYPSNRPHHGVSPGDEGGSIWDGFGDFGGSGGLAGLGGLGGLGGLLAIGKGLLALKPLLLIGLLLLIAIPVLLLFLPIPIITVSNLPSLSGMAPSMDQKTRGAYGQSLWSTYLSQLSERVLNSEECIERLICKIPQAPGKFQGKAKILWEEYGKKYFSSTRVQRALSAYFDEASTGRSRISKCNQKFKCSSKFF